MKIHVVEQYPMPPSKTNAKYNIAELTRDKTSKSQCVLAQSFYHDSTLLMTPTTSIKFSQRGANHRFEGSTVSAALHRVRVREFLQENSVSFRSQRSCPSMIHKTKINFFSPLEGDAARSEQSLQEAKRRSL